MHDYFTLSLILRHPERRGIGRLYAGIRRPPIKTSRDKRKPQTKFFILTCLKKSWCIGGSSVGYCYQRYVIWGLVAFGNYKK